MSEAETITETTEVRVSATPIAMSGIILSMMFMGAASGIGFAYLPIRLASLGFEPWVAAAMTPALALGGLFGCLITGWLLRLSGHARVFMTVYAFISLSFLGILVTENAYAWVVFRFMYGFGINGAFIVAQSWLHHASTDDNRGRVITIFYILYVLSLGSGSFMIGLLDAGTIVPIAVSIGLVTAAIFPVGLTRLAQPEAPDEVNVQIRKLWKISPVGLVGMLTVGGLTMTLQGYAPIYAGTLDYTPADIGLLMFTMQLGLLVVQLPLGALSDRIDRRYVLIIVSTMSVSLAIVSIVLESNISFVWLIFMFAIWVGSIETIYSVSSALANDRADPKDYVFLSSTQMIMWSLGGFIIPLTTTAMIAYFPVTIFMWFILVLSGCFTLFVIYRIFARNAVSVDDMESHQYVTAQVVNSGEYYNPEAISEALETAGVSEGLVN